MMFRDTVIGPGALVRIHHERPYDFDEKTNQWVYRQIGEDEVVHNVLLDAARRQIHAQSYGTSGLASNGFNYLALSNDPAAPVSTDTILTDELVGNGLSRGPSTVTLPTGADNHTTVQKAFTFTGGYQEVQKCALFNSAVGGVMGHEVQFTQRVLVTDDVITFIYNITLG